MTMDKLLFFLQSFPTSYFTGTLLSTSMGFKVDVISMSTVILSIPFYSQ